MIVLEVVLGREIIRFGFTFLADPRGELVVLMKMMRDGAEVVEELAQQIPAAVFLHHGGAEELVAR